MDKIDFQERDQFLTEAEAYFAGDDLRTVLEMAESRLARSPGDLTARMMICRAWIRQGRLDEARERLAEMEELLTPLSPLYVSLGDLCQERGLHNEAASLYEKFIRFNPRTPLAIEIAGRLRDLGAEDVSQGQGRADSEDAGEVPPDFQTVTLADLYIRQGHLNQAADVLKAILKKDPEQEKAAQRLREVREMLSGSQWKTPGPSVAAELLRWLNNIGRLRTHGA